MTIATILVLGIIVVELYRPIIIGDAIDDYINGYYHPYIETEKTDEDAVSYHGIYLERYNGKPKSDGKYYQIFLYHDKYYMAEEINADECRELKEGENSVLKTYVDAGAPLLLRDELTELRQSDFHGILLAAGVYLLMLALGFMLNAVDTWMLQKMGQNIIYKMREEVFAHIHSLSLNFFNTTPVGKLVTRVSNDTEAINELFSTILVKLFKNIVKIIGYAVVMLSIDVRMAGISFLLLPLVTVLTFVFRFLSRKAYQITRNKIT